jgi:hypothetical protein
VRRHINEYPPFLKPFPVIGHLLFGVHRFSHSFSFSVSGRQGGANLHRLISGLRQRDTSAIPFYFRHSFGERPVVAAIEHTSWFGHRSAAIRRQNMHGHSQSSVTPVSFTGGKLHQVSTILLRCCPFSVCLRVRDP